MVSLNQTPLFSTLNKPKWEAWRTHKDTPKEKHTNSAALLQTLLWVCTYPQLSFLLGSEKKTGEIYFLLLEEWKSWQNHWRPSSDPSHLQSATGELLGSRTVHTTTGELLSVPSTQAEYKARCCLDNKLLPQFSQVTSQVCEQSSPSVLQGVLPIF